MAKGTRITMRKYIKLVLMICILGILTCGCGKKDKEEKTVPLTIYDVSDFMSCHQIAHIS